MKDSTTLGETNVTAFLTKLREIEVSTETDYVVSIDVGDISE